MSNETKTLEQRMAELEARVQRLEDRADGNAVPVKGSCQRFVSRGTRGCGLGQP